jgi:hypothetical protein
MHSRLLEPLLVAMAAPELAPLAVDCAWAALPFTVAAKELAFAAGPVAVAVAFAGPPSSAVEVAFAVAAPVWAMPPGLKLKPPAACATADPPLVAERLRWPGLLGKRKGKKRR